MYNVDVDITNLWRTLVRHKITIILFFDRLQNNMVW